jgi:hypothetical protein
MTALAKMASHNESKAGELFEKLRWPNGAACPRCGGAAVRTSIA